MARHRHAPARLTRNLGIQRFTRSRVRIQRTDHLDVTQAFRGYEPVQTDPDGPELLAAYGGDCAAVVVDDP